MTTAAEKLILDDVESKLSVAEAAAEAAEAAEAFNEAVDEVAAVAALAAVHGYSKFCLSFKGSCLLSFVNCPFHDR